MITAPNAAYAHPATALYTSTPTQYTTTVRGRSAISTATSDTAAPEMMKTTRLWKRSHSHPPHSDPTVQATADATPFTADTTVDDAA